MWRPTKTTCRTRTSRRRAAWLAGLGTALALCLGPAFGATAVGEAPRPDASDPPKLVVDKLASQTIAILQNQGINSDQKRQQIESVVYDYVDFKTLSRLVLARNWPKFSPAQRDDFQREFKKHLSITYGRNVDNYKNEKVQILDERQEARGDVSVHTKILRGGGSEDIVVDYRLRNTGGQWQIIDVIVEGVSLVSNFRSQFQDIVANGGPDRLLVLLREKNAAGESLQKN